MALSGSFNYTRTRDEIIAQALRKVNTTGTGETPEAALVTEVAASLNNVIKSFQGEGMPLWLLQTIQFTPSIGSASVTIGTSGIVNTLAAPLKVLQAYRSTTSGGTTSDISLQVLSHFDYNLIPTKAQAGTPIQVFYKEPGAVSNVESNGTLYMWPVPDANFVTTNSGTISLLVHKQADDVDAAGDHINMPPYFYQALIWALADEIAPEQGVGLAERAQIHKRALEERALAFSFNTEEGSIRFVPDAQYMAQFR